MSKYLHISDHLRLPVDWITLATVVYGARGSGKTTFGSVCAEEATKVGQRFCAIDLKGDWYGLKSSPDGKHDGIPVVVFGGEHADVPLEPDAGAFVGETVASMSQSSILDLELLSKGKQIRFLASFFESLYDRNREPLLLLADESQRYAPQGRAGQMNPDMGKCLGAVEDVVKLGRKHGIGVVLFTQRGSGLNKEVSELCDMLVAFRTPGPLDQDRVKDWLDANTTKTQRDEVMGQLSGLHTGTAVFASGHPDLKIFGAYQVRQRETFDSSATPKVGQRKVEPTKLATPDLEDLRVRMSAAIERQKADDPKELRKKNAEAQKRIAELERQLTKPQPKATQSEPKIVEKKVVIEATIARLEKLVEKTSKLEESLRDTSTQITAVSAEAAGMLQDARKINEAISEPKALEVFNPGFGKPEGSFSVKIARVRHSAGAVSMAGRPTPSAPSIPSVNGHLPEGEAKILAALIQYPLGLSRGQIGALTGYTKRSTRNTYLQRLGQKGYVTDSGERMVATQEGIAALPNCKPLPVGVKLQRYWLDKLPEGEKKILEVLIEVYPQNLTREEISARTGYEKRSTRNTYLQRLSQKELVTGSMNVRASDNLFME